MMSPVRFMARLFACALLPMLVVLPALAFGRAAARPQAEPDVTVTIRDGGFAPQSAAAAAGDRVRWVNEDDRDYSLVTDAKALGGFSSGTIKPGGSWTYTVPADAAAGSHAYSCKLRPRAKGTLRVGS